MFRNLLLASLVWTVIAGPFVALATTAAGGSLTGAKVQSSCFIAGIGCAKGPMILPAISRMK